MVKGITKRVVIVKSPANTLFDEAIFILKEDALGSSGVDADHILQEACRVADNYVHRHCARKKRLRIPPAGFMALGAFMTGIAWIISLFI